MSGLKAAPMRERRSDTPPANADSVPRAVEFRYTQTESFPVLLNQLGYLGLVLLLASLACTPARLLFSTSAASAPSGSS